MTDGVETVGNDRRGPDMPSSVMPAASVIPDIFNRESRGFFPVGGHTNEGTERKDWIPARTLRE